MYGEVCRIIGSSRPATFQLFLSSVVYHSSARLQPTTYYTFLVSSRVNTCWVFSCCSLYSLFTFRTAAKPFSSDGLFWNRPCVVFACAPVCSVWRCVTPHFLFTLLNDTSLLHSFLPCFPLSMICPVYVHFNPNTVASFLICNIYVSSVAVDMC